MTSQQLLARAPAGRTGRRGFYETVPCVVCGQPFDRRNHPTRTVLPRKTCGRAECVDLNARRLQAAWRAAHPDACRAYEKKYRRANRAKINTADRASYARRKAAAGKEKTECVMCFAEFERPALGRHPRQTCSMQCRRIFALISAGKVPVDPADYKKNARAYWRRWYHANPEKAAAYHRKYFQANKERIYARRGAQK